MMNKPAGARCEIYIGDTHVGIEELAALETPESSTRCSR